jgi:hypothetical protein
LKTPRGEQPEAEECQATQRPNEKGQKDEQQTTNIIRNKHRTKEIHRCLILLYPVKFQC